MALRFLEHSCIPVLTDHLHSCFIPEDSTIANIRTLIFPCAFFSRSACLHNEAEFHDVTSTAARAGIAE